MIFPRRDTKKNFFKENYSCKDNCGIKSLII